MFKKKPKKEKVYKCAICELEESPYANAKYQVIFLSDVYIKEKNGKYVNYFNEDEVYELSNGKYHSGDIQIILRNEQIMDTEQVFWDMFFNKNYCKDRLMAAKKYFNDNPTRLRPNIFDRYREVLEIDSAVEQRYNRGVKNKILTLKK